MPNFPTLFLKQVLLGSLMLLCLALPTANAGTLRAQISLPSSKIASGDIGNTITICSFEFPSIVLGCEVTPVIITDGSNTSIEVDVPFIDANSIINQYEIITECLSNCAGFGTEQQYYQFDGTFRPRQTSTFDSRFPTRLDIVIPEVFDVSMKLPSTQFANDDIINTLEVCEDDTCRLEFLTIEDGTNSATTQFVSLHGVEYSLIANCVLNCDGYLNNTERRFLANGTWSNNTFSRPFEFAGLANPIELTLLKTFSVNGRISLPNAETAIVGITSAVSICSYDNTGVLLGCIEQSIVLETATNEISFSSFSVIDAGAGGEYSVSTQCVSRCVTFLSALRSMKPDGSFVYSSTPRVSADDLIANIEIELERGDTLPIRITTAGQTSAEVDQRMTVTLCSYDDALVQLGCTQGSSTLAQGESSLEFDLTGVISVDEGGSYSVLHTNAASIPYQRYLNNDGSSTPFLKYDYDNREPPLIAKNNLPTIVEIELWENFRINGDVNLPEAQGRPPLEGSVGLYTVAASACSYDADDILVFCIDTYFNEGFITARDSYSFTLPLVERIDYYIISASCGGAPCSDRLLSSSQFLRNDGTFGYGEEKVLAEKLLRINTDFILAFKNGDQDGDSVVDEFDNCLNETNHLQEDIDGDGKGNKCDADDDGDGMPDSWEILRGLNPNVANGDDDPDGDGFSNLREYELGFDPLVHDTDDNDNGISDRLEDGLRIVPLLKLLLLKKNN